MILSILSLIFLFMYINFYIRFRPSLDYVEGRYILWYTVKGKGDTEEYRDYIELF